MEEVKQFFPTVQDLFRPEDQTAASIYLDKIIPWEGRDAAVVLLRMVTSDKVPIDTERYTKDDSFGRANLSVVG